MPRPVKDDPRDRFKTFRFTQAEITRLQGRARAEGMTFSNYVRTRALDLPRTDPWSGASEDLPGSRTRVTGTYGAASFAANERGAGDRRRPSFAIRSLAEQLRRIGVNLNQIAHRMNELRIPPPRELTMVLDEIRDYVRKIREL